MDVNFISAGKAQNFVVWLLGILTCAMPLTAFAHTSPDHAYGFVTGFLHPLMGMDHIIAMVAVGLWSVQMGRKATLVLPMTFPIVMALGGALGVFGMSVPGIEIGIAVSAMVLGGLVATAAIAPLWAAGVLVGMFAVFHGYAHGAELPVATNPFWYSCGFLLATAGLHVSGILMGHMNRWRVGNYLLRTAGAVIAGCGAYFLSLALT